MPTVLFVEDALDLAEAVRRELEADGYRVRYAADGRRALELFEQEPPDLVILDWLLPGLDGLEVLRRIRSQSPVPVLMLTARTDEIDRVLGLEVGADDYLTKPFSMRELIARVHALLRRLEHVHQMRAADREKPAGTLVYGPLTLEPETYQVRINGDALDLTPTEFDLLGMLMRSPGRAFSRTYLLEAVWGEDYIPGDRSVDNAILRLRKKLGPIGDAIETVWGVGYRLKPES